MNKKRDELNRKANDKSKNILSRSGNKIIGVKIAVFVLDFCVRYCNTAQYGQIIDGFSFIIFLIVCFQFHCLLQFWQVGILPLLSYNNLY